MSVTRAAWLVNGQRAVLVRMLREGYSASQIGEHFQVSRNAVIGVVHRDKEFAAIGFAASPGKRPLDYQPKRRRKKSALPKPPRPKQPKTSLGERRVRGGAVSPLAFKKPKHVYRPSQHLDAPPPLNIALMDLETKHCRWPVNDPPPHTDGHRFCGHAKFGLTSYCEYHAAKAVGQGTESERSAQRVLEKFAA